MSESGGIIHDPQSWARWIKTDADRQAVANGHWFDVKAAERFREFCRRFIRFTKDERKGRPFELLDWQYEQIFAPLLGWKRADGKRRFRKVYISTAKKSGKALALDTPIATPAGWTTMGELRPGDQVFNENGLPCAITAATEIMHDHDCFEVEFSDGEKIVADADHQWYVHSWRPEGWGIRTTRELADNLIVPMGKGVPARNYSVAVAGALHTDHANLPIDPYTLGYWLGNGTSTTGDVTVADYDAATVTTEIARHGYLVEPPRATKGHAITCLVGKGQTRGPNNGSFQSTLRANSLLNNKHVPPAYLRASYSQRLALLQGLMDSDGTCATSGECEFSSTRRCLAYQALELIRSLGFKATIYECRATLYGRDISENYRVRFHPFADTPVFRLNRKSKRQKVTPAKPTRNASRQIVAVRPVPSVPVRCIEVDSPSHLYLAGRGFTPTHNSTLLGALAIYLLLTEGPRTEIYSAAVEREQASIIFKEAAAMVKVSPALSKLIQTKPSTKTLVCDDSVYRALSSDAGSKEGLDASIVLVDELHAWKDRALFDALAYAGSARPNPLTIIITTSGDDLNSVWGEEYTRAKRWLSGDYIDDSYYAVIHEADPQDDWAKPETWAKANPSLGHTVKLEEIERECKEAQEIPAKQAAFKRYRCNLLVSLEATWINLDQWDKCPKIIDLDSLQGQPCWAGLDLSSVNDMTALVLAFDGPDGQVITLPRFWLPRQNLDALGRQHKVSYRAWLDAGHLHTTDGNCIDYDQIVSDITELAKRYDIRQIGIDRLFQGQAVETRLQSLGMDVVPIGQGWVSQSLPAKELERLIAAGQLNHGGHPVLRWHAGNVVAKRDDADNVSISKKRSRDKIDGIAAMLMALLCRSKTSHAPAAPIYEKAPDLTFI